MPRLTATIIALVVLALTDSGARADAPRTHDGFFLRVGLGVGGLDMKRSGTLSSASNSVFTGDSRISGGSSAFELSIGGALRPGLVLAGTFANQVIGDPALKRDNEADLSLDGPLTFALLGVLLDYHPNPQGGFHFGGTVAVAGAWVKSPPPRFTEYLGGVGGALALHAGYSWWLSEQWGMGVLARATFAGLHGEDTQLGITGSEDDRVSAFTLLASATFN